MDNLHKRTKNRSFYSDLSLFDNRGNESKTKIIFVNNLLFIKLTLYQTDWNIVGLKLNLNNEKIFQVPVKKISKGGRSFWFGSIFK